MKIDLNTIKIFLCRSYVLLVIVVVCMMLAGQSIAAGIWLISIPSLAMAFSASLVFAVRSEKIKRVMLEAVPLIPKDEMDKMIQKEFDRARSGLSLVKPIVTILCIIAWGVGYAGVGVWWQVGIAIVIISLLMGFVVVSIENLGLLMRGAVDTIDQSGSPERT